MDGRAAPWDPAKGPARGWVQDFLERHPELSTWSNRIFEGSLVEEDDKGRLRELYRALNEYDFAENYSPHSVWSPDEADERATGNQ